MRVFIVEDSPLLRTRLEAMLAAIPGAGAVGYAEGADDAERLGARGFFDRSTEFDRLRQALAQ